MGIGALIFFQSEQKASLRYKGKPRKTLSKDPTIFNCSIMNQSDDGSITMRQTDKISLLQPPTNQKSFTSQRAMAQYVGVNTRPDVTASVHLFAPGNEPATEDDFRILKRKIGHMKNTKYIGLTYRPLDISSTRLVLITDASFANARGLKCQLGYFLLMTNKDGT